MAPRVLPAVAARDPRGGGAPPSWPRFRRAPGLSFPVCGAGAVASLSRTGLCCHCPDGVPAPPLSRCVNSGTSRAAGPRRVVGRGEESPSSHGRSSESPEARVGLLEFIGRVWATGGQARKHRNLPEQQWVWSFVGRGEGGCSPFDASGSFSGSPGVTGPPGPHPAPQAAVWTARSADPKSLGDKHKPAGTKYKARQGDV